MDLKTGGVFFSLRGRMLVYFGLLLVAVMVLLGLTLMFGLPFSRYGGEYAEVREEAFRGLDSIADLKKERLALWLDYHRKEAEEIALNSYVRSGIDDIRRELQRAVRKGKAYSQLHEFLGSRISIRGEIARVDITDESGRVIVSSDESAQGGKEGPEVYYAALVAGGSFINIVPDEAFPGGVKLVVSRAMTDVTGGKSIVVLHVSPQDFIIPLLHSARGLGKTGETLLVRQDGTVLTPLKYALPDGTQPVPFKFRISAKPATLAAAGREGIVMAEDYRGVPVMAAVRTIEAGPGLRWGLVVKIDRKEAFRHLRDTILYSSVMGAALIALGLLVTYMISESLSRPVKALSDAAGRVLEGELDARAEVFSTGEMGLLAETFNSMVQSVQQWRGTLESEVARRTEELNRANEGLNAEIAERMRTEAEIITERDRAQRYLDIAGVMIVVIGSDQRVSLINRKGCEILGYAEEEIVGRNWFDGFIPQEVAEDVKKVFDQLMEGTVDPVEYYTNQVMTRGGKRTMAWHNTIVKDETGKIMGTLSSGEDVTERMKAEEKLKQQAQIIEQSYNSVISMDMEGNITSWNRGAERMLGYAEEEVLGRNVEIIYPEEDRDILRNQVIGPLKKEGTHEIEVRLRKKTGEDFYALLSLWLLRNAGVEPLGMVGYSIDITARRHAEEQLLDSLREKDLLLKEIHHRVKNNMQVISSLLKLQSAYVKLEDDRQMFKESQNRIRSMAIIHEKLYESKDLDRVDLGGYIRALTRSLLYSYGVEASRVRVSHEVDEKSAIGVDTAIPVGLMLNELLSNSLKHAFPHGAEGRVMVTLKGVDDGAFDLVVKDDGVGLPPGFDLKGTGTLGIQLIDSLVSQLKGKVEVMTDHGAEFRITFRELKYKSRI